MKKITSADNPRLKAAVRLKTSRGRKTQQRIIIFGLRELQHALASGIEPLEVFLSSEILAADEIEELLQATGANTQFLDLPTALMSKLQYGERQDGVVAIAQRPELKLDRLQVPNNGLVVILEAIEKPGNIGAVIRSMDGAGADALVLADPQCDVLHPNCIRASLGAAFRIPIATGSTEQVINWCRQQELEMFATSDAASTSYTDADLTGKIAIALGNESHGLSAAWNLDDVRHLAIPMSGISDSLNISVAAGVILFEARRQRSAR
ncbi:MAG: TrmH family RNA methyltransferase [Pirellulaceae bacterium]